MEESGVFEYWFALIFALGFCVWFPAYVIKTKGRGIPLWFAEFIMGAENEKRLITFYTIAVPSLMVFPYALSTDLIMKNIKKMFNKQGGK